jgi:hypothetical protein
LRLFVRTVRRGGGGGLPSIGPSVSTIERERPKKKKTAGSCTQSERGSSERESERQRESVVEAVACVRAYYSTDCFGH